MAAGAQGLIVSNSDFKKKALELADPVKHEGFSASGGWVTKVKKLNGLRYRKTTHTSRKTKFTEDDMLEQQEFHDNVVDIVMNERVPLKNMVNMDQTCMRMVSPYSKTLEKIGVKDVLASQPCGDKSTFTVSLAVRADGSKMPAVIIFKASNKQTSILSESIMQKLKVPENVIVWSSVSGWWNERLDHMWIDTTFKDDGEEEIIIRDQYPVHEMESSLNRLEERGVHQIAVPSEMTGKLQPLDVGVNRPFKIFWSESYHEWRNNLAETDVTKSDYLRNPDRQELIDMVSVCWFKVTAECIKNSFVKAEIIPKEFV